MSKIKVIDFLGRFTLALSDQLVEDEKKWGDTWLQRFPEGQEARIWEHIQTYFDQFFNAGIPVPWLKVAGLAMIAWIRDTYPEVWNNE